MKPVRKSWFFLIAADGLYVWPVYNGQNGCRMWRVETLGL
jgi:hypothetical protein